MEVTELAGLSNRIVSTIHKILTENITELVLLDQEFVQTLLAEPLQKQNEDEDFMLFVQAISKNATQGYPTRPFYKQVAYNLTRLLISRKNNDNPRSNQWPNSLGLNIKEHAFLEETDTLISKINSYFHGDISKDLDEMLNDSVRTLFYKLRKSDIAVLLGLGRTEGSLDALPPDILTLWNSFQTQHHPKSTLTVGARALAKHCHRSSEHFWGVCTGSEGAKNKHALEVLQKIFLDCDWMNIHVLPHEMYVLEIRCSQGYGLRWKHDGTAFRGFLEPQMENGHEVGWKH